MDAIKKLLIDGRVVRDLLPHKNKRWRLGDSDYVVVSEDNHIVSRQTPADDYSYGHKSCGAIAKAIVFDHNHSELKDLLIQTMANALKSCDVALKAAKPCVNGGWHMNEKIAEDALELVKSLIEGWREKPENPMDYIGGFDLVSGLEVARSLQIGDVIGVKVSDEEFKTVRIQGITYCDTDGNKYAADQVSFGLTNNKPRFK